MPSHGKERYKIFGTAPEIEKLPNSRFRVIVRCDVGSVPEDWYYANRARLWRDFGDLYSAPIEAGDGWEAKTGEAYPNQALIAQEFKYLQGKEGPVVEFIYETLTDTWTNEDDDDDSSTENGLRTLIRTQVALPDTALPYDEDDVGVETITVNQLPDSMVVEDAGTEAANGVYLRDGSLNGKPKYVDGDWVIYWGTVGFGDGWIIDNGGFASYDSSENVATPNLVASWTANGFDTPTPTVRYATWDDIDAAGIDRSTVPLLAGTGKTLYLAGFEDQGGEQIGRVVSRWAEAGTLRTSRRSASDGVFEATTVFLGVKGSVTGPVVAESIDNVQGFRTFSVTTLQRRDGTSIVDNTTPVNSVAAMIPFTYPGVISLNVESPETWIRKYSISIDEPPAKCKLKGTVYTFFQTTNSVADSDFVYESAEGYYSPNNWASFKVEAEASSLDGTYFSTEGPRGYRCSSTSVDITIVPAETGSTGTQFWFNGVRRVVDTSSIDVDITIDQGPPDPIGSKWVVDLDYNLAFEDVDGNAYYKKTIVVVDTVPTQVSNQLPYPPPAA